jgi:hypothetical protein
VAALKACEGVYDEKDPMRPPRHALSERNLPHPFQFRMPSAAAWSRSGHADTTAARPALPQVRLFAQYEDGQSQRRKRHHAEDAAA